LFPIDGINIEVQATVETLEKCEGVEPLKTFECDAQTDLMHPEFQLL